MPWIENISLGDVPKGRHHNAGENSMLIQIVDPGMEFPVPRHQFKETHQFEFLDLEKDDKWGEEFKVTDTQAEQLVRLLQHALENRMNVVVHCVAGVCRSGAVCEVGVMMGFQDTEAYRSPNLMVKHKMMKVLGWTYDENEPHTINGVPFEYDELGNKKIWVPPEKKIHMTKIYELAKQAAEHAVLNYSGEALQSETDDVKIQIPKEFIDQFSKLILEECIDIAEQTRYDGKVVAERIKFVFGVKDA